MVTGLRSHGVAVRVAMTAAATRFVSPMTFQSLSGCPVSTSVWDKTGDVTSNGMAHLSLAAWADCQVAVPASADLLARLALGLANDTVTAAALGCPAPLLVVPAMETEMWLHRATQGHVDTLRARGVRVVGPASGRLASGAEGVGRMVEPELVVKAVLEAVDSVARPAPSTSNPGDPTADAGWLEGRRVVVTAGGTREPIDPVRYIGNRSSGKMGNALVREALRLGANVTLVTTAAPPEPDPNLCVVEVETAAEMLDAVTAALPGAVALVMAAAVADYRPAVAVSSKIKKSMAPLTLELEPTTDILRALRPRHSGTLVVGFAAETDDLLSHAHEKLHDKGLDLIVANDVSVPGIAMGADDNAVVIIGRDGVVADVPRAPKAAVAGVIFGAMRHVLEP